MGDSSFKSQGKANKGGLVANNKARKFNSKSIAEVFKKFTSTFRRKFLKECLSPSGRFEANFVRSYFIRFVQFDKLDQRQSKSK